MRRFLLIILVSFTLITLFLLFTPFLLTLLGLDKPLSEYVLSSIENTSQQKIQINQIHFGFGNVVLEKLDLSNQSGKFQFAADGLQFDYNIFSFLVHLQKPQRAINKISLINPVVTIRPGAGPDSISVQTSDSSAFSLAQILDQFESIDRINIKNGQILLQNEENEKLPISQKLDGWMSAANDDSLDIDASGGLFSAIHKNFSISAHFNKSKKQFTADMSITVLNLADFDLPESYRSLALAGLINGALQIHSPDLNRLVVNGRLNIIRGELTVSRWHLQNIQAQALITDNEMVISEGSVNSDDNTAFWQVEVPDIFMPEFSGELRGKRVSLNSLTRHLQLKGTNEGEVDVSARFLWSAGTLKSDVELQAGEITLQSQTLAQLQTRLSLEADSVIVKHFSALYKNFTFSGTGNLDLGSGDYLVKLNGRKPFSRHEFFDLLSEKGQELDLALCGNLDRKQIDGLWKYCIAIPGDTVLNCSGKIKLENGHFQLQKDRVPSDNFSLVLDITDIFNDAYINYGYIENPPLRKFSSWFRSGQLPVTTQVEGVLNGPLNDLNMQVSLLDKEKPERQFILTGHIRDLLHREKQLSGDFSYHEFSGKYALLLTENQLKGYLQSESNLRAQVDLDIAAGKSIRALIDFDNFQTSKIFDNDPANELGEISGAIEIGGTLANPSVKALLAGDRFVKNNVGYYRFNLAMLADSARVQVDSLRLYLNNVPVLKGNGIWDLPGEQVQAEISGSGINFEDIIQTFGTQSLLVTGITDYDIKISGSERKPRLVLDATINNGEIYKTAFDYIHVTARDSVPADGDFSDWTGHSLVIQNLVAVKRGLYHLESNGSIPFRTDNPLSLDLSFNGDLLSFIPKFDRFFVDGASFSDVALKIRGTPANPKIDQGRINIDRGELWLAAVAEHVQNIRGSIEKPAGSNKVYIRNLKAEVNKQILDINTLDNVTTSDGKKLEPWYFKDLDLDFGILSLQTSPGGIRLQIPGLMIEGEQGNLELNGKDNGETFYFAGPVRHPYAWGKVVYSNSRFSFPFPPAHSEKPSVVVEFLKSIDWDVLVIPGVDLLYVRKIPAFLGDINAEIAVDPESDGILFKGILAENSFIPVGSARSSRGRLEYLDQNFRVESYGIIFDGSEELPEVYGRAWTSVRDSVGAVPKTVYLELYAVDKETGQHNFRARWEDLRFRLTSADPTIGESQEQVLAYLGYSVGNIKEKATTIGGAVTENYVIRPLLRPLERRLEHYLGIDFVRFNSRIAKNIFQVGLSQWYAPTTLSGNLRYQDTFNPYMILLESSELTLGKYLAENLYVTYTGQLIANSRPNQNDISFNHSFGIEYRFFKSLLLEFEYDRETLYYAPVYMDKPYVEDFKIRLRHSFSF